MSFFSSHLGSSSGKQKDGNRKRSSSIKQAFASILGASGSKSSGSTLSRSNSNGRSASVPSSNSARRASSRRPSGAYGTSAMPAGFSPMMAFGTPYSIYGYQDYGAPQNELAMSSEEGTDNEIDEDQGDSSLLDYSLGGNDSDGDLGNDIYTSSLQPSRFQSQPNRRMSNDDERGGPFSVVSDDEDDDEYDGPDNENDGDDEGDDDDFEENCLGRRITRVSTAFSATGSQISNTVVNRKKTAKTCLLNYLADRGLLRPRLLSSKNGVTFHVATSGDNIFLPTISPTDDEYLNHLSRLNDDDDDGAFGDALERLATRDPSEFSRSDVVPTGSHSTIFANRENESLATGNSEFASSNPVQSSLTEETGNGNTTNIEPTDSYTAMDDDSPAADSENIPYNIAVIMSLKKQMELSSVKAELYSRVRVYWSNGLPPDKMETEEYYTGGHLDWEFNTDNYNLYVGFSAADQELVIIENTQNLCRRKNFKNIQDFGDRPYLKKQKTKDNFLKDINEASDTNSCTFQPGDYIFIVPVVFANNIPETICLPSARVNYHFRCAAKVINSDNTDSANNDSTKSNDNDSGLSNNGTGSTLAFQSNSNDDSNPPSSAGDGTTSHFKFGGGKLFKKMKNHLHLPSYHGISKTDYQKMVYSHMALNLVRTPPLRSISTADKPIYINRIWTDSLSYEISFGQKYVPLDVEIPLKLKLVPLVKHLSVKRIRICVVEKITYVSKNLQYEFDQVELVANDPYSPYYPEFSSRRKPERILPLLEIRTRDKGGRAMKEEIVENCKSDNLLCYSTVRDENTNSNVEMVEALTIDTKLKFPKYKLLNKKSARSVPPYGIDEFTQLENIKSNSTSRRGSTTSGVIDFLSGRKSRKNSSISNNLDLPKPTTKFRTNSNLPIVNHTRLNEPKRGLYASSVNFSHINVKHKLEIMLRISKPDATDPTKQRHFEVLIDTPVHVVSELCTSDNLELPTYAMATMSHPDKDTTISFHEPLPSFEEAISVPNSPRVSPIGTPQLRATYDPDDLSIQQLMLSRASTQNVDDLQSASSVARRYSNIDEMMGQSGLTTARSPNPGPTVTFKESFMKQGMKAESSLEESLESDSEDAEAILSDDEPPTYEEITPLM